MRQVGVFQDSYREATPELRHRADSDGVVVDVVIPAGTLEPESACACGTSRALLPVPESTLIETLLHRLVAAFDGSLTVCANEHAGPLTERLARASVLASRVQLYEDGMPRGTAGCIKACEPNLQGDMILVAGGSVWLDEDPQWLVTQHREKGNALTVFCAREPVAPGSGRVEHLKPVSLFCCDRRVLDFIPRRGYHDLKEQLVPALRDKGLAVGAVVVEGRTREVSGWASYLDILSQVLSGDSLQARGYRQLAPGVWCGDSVEIAPQARVVGPAFIGHGCTLEEDVVVIGPAVLGHGSRVGARSWLVRAIAPENSQFPPEVMVADRYVPSSVEMKPGTPASASLELECEPFTHAATPRVSPVTDSSTSEEDGVRAALAKTSLIGALVVGTFAWAFWDTIVGLWTVWQTNADYSAGQLVPLAAAYMVYVRRRDLAGLTLQFGGAGLFVFAAGLALNLAGRYYLYSSLEYVGLVVCANGLAISLLGRRGYSRIWYPLVFLLLMVPLPGRLHDGVLLPLQGISAQLSAGVLEIIGVPAIRFGNVLEVGGHQVAVAEACSGLRMAIAFLMVAGVVAYLVKRPRWHKVTVLFSSVPIAVVCNVVRIVVTAYLYGAGYERMARGVFHDAAGLLMMPIALCLILVELRLLTHLGPERNGSEMAGSTGGRFGGKGVPATATDL